MITYTNTDENELEYEQRQFFLKYEEKITKILDETQPWIACESFSDIVFLSVGSSATGTTAHDVLETAKWKRSFLMSCNSNKLNEV